MGERDMGSELVSPPTRRFRSSALIAALLLAELAACTTHDDPSSPQEEITNAVSAAPSNTTPRAAASSSSYTLFESGQVRPLALSPSGKFLFAVNTPDNRLEVFKIGPEGLVHRGSVPVGLEPVAVAARSDD